MPAPDPVVVALAQLGGTASSGQLLTVVSRHRLQRAVAERRVLRVARGRYCLPELDRAMVAAVRLHGVVSHRSAALLRGWELHRPPPEPEIVVARHRDIPAARRRGVAVRWRQLSAEEVQARVTSPLRTVIDCARDLRLVDSLAVADAARRAGDVSGPELRAAVAGLPRTGRAKAERVLLQASAAPANAFESTLRALSIEAVGPLLVPQVSFEVAGLRVRPDLVCRRLRLVIEADSFAFHTKRHQLVRDCWRYNERSLAGWLVLRFTWDQVMFSPEWVVDVIRRAVALQRAKGLTP